MTTLKSNAKRWGGALAALAAGCAQQSPSASPSPPTPTRTAPAGPAARPTNAAAPQEQFLARIRQASRPNGVIVNARMNGDNELSVVLGPRVKKSEIQPLMKTLLKEMRDTFGQQALTVRAYAPNNKQLAVARYSPGARPDTTLTFAPGF